ncbi:MAG TPA: hypothetical protein VGN96_15785 [Roseococcus sp.]|jgi:hypothetical protein|nr:hypothetical protein [Roseococcus sp.]
MDLSQVALADDAQTDGAWIAPRLGETMEFLCVAKSPKFRAREIRALRDLAKVYGEVFAIPAWAEAQRMGPVYLEEGMVRGVRGLFHDRERTQPVQLGDLGALIAQKKFSPLYEQMKLAVEMASTRLEADAEAALGNSSDGSDGTAAAEKSKPSSPARTPS